MTASAVVGPVEALSAGRAFVDLSFWRKVAVTGTDAFGWLNDLVSADLSGVQPGLSRRAVLLSPTGHIRAEFTVAMPDREILLVQDPSQPNAVEALLARYVLSSDVSLLDRTDELALFAFPGRTTPPAVTDAMASVPSALGGGVDVLVAGDRHDGVLEELARTLTPAGNEDVERWRVVAGIPRFGVDGTEEDLPAEAGLEDAVAYGKGCYLGQEAVAKVRNLGHPRRVLLHLTASAPLSAGETVVAEDVEVGGITSVADHAGRWWALGKVKWEARARSLRTAGGVALLPAGEA